MNINQHTEQTTSGFPLYYTSWKSLLYIMSRKNVAFSCVNISKLFNKATAWIVLHLLVNVYCYKILRLRLPSLC